MPPLFLKQIKLIECVEKTFFKTIIVISLVGCFAVILLETLVLKRFDTNLQWVILLLQVLLATLYGLRKMSFTKITTGSMVTMCALCTYRGLVTDDFNEVNYTLLITFGFISSLVLKRRISVTLSGIVLVCLLILLFKNYDVVATGLLVRKAIPYLVVFSIVTVCSGILKGRYERNQERLRTMVEILRPKCFAAKKLSRACRAE
jgi:hypothetical protein